MKTNIKKTKRKFSIDEKKYRISIIEGMQPEKIKKYGFEKSYFIFERSINKMSKSGDAAEEKGLEYLKDKQLLSQDYRTNKVIALSNIKIEADIIDYENKIVYEIKSRKKYDSAKKAIRDKWMVFEYDKLNSNYKDFQFKGIIVVNEDIGPVVKRVYDLQKSRVNKEKMKIKFDNFYSLLDEYKKINKERK